MLRPAPLLALVAAFCLAGCGPRAATEPTLIGHIASLDKPSGEHAKQGILLAVEEANEAGSERRLAVNHVDDRDGAVAQAEAVRLVALNKVVGLLVDAEPGRAE